MNRAPTARAGFYSAAGIAGLVGGLASGRPELVAAGAPFLIGVGLALVLGVRHRLDLSPASGTIRTIEGTAAEFSITVSTPDPVPRIEVLIRISPSVRIVGVRADGTAIADIVARDMLSVALPTPGVHEIKVALHGDHWGAYPIGFIAAFRSGRFGVFRHTKIVHCRTVLKVFPRPVVVRRLLRPVETSLGFGDLVARRTGPGLEFADLREMQPGDDPRQINWRAVARGRGYWINERHPDRNSDVVLLVDTLLEARRGIEGILDPAVRAAAGLAASHLGRHDRVGLVTFGEPVRWLQPGMGDVQRYRILDTLMESLTRHQMYWRGIAAVPRRALPARALVIGLTPLLDERSIHAFADLRGRGFDLAIIELPAERFVPAPGDRIEEAARRIWDMQRAAARRSFARHGVAIVPWDPADPFEVALMEVEAFRRNAQRARV